MTQESKTTQDAALVEALRDIKRDLEMCDWQCVVCRKDPEMLETDIYFRICEALKPYEGTES